VGVDFLFVMLLIKGCISSAVVFVPDSSVLFFWGFRVLAT
jgi:hypothetical protein